MSTKTTQGKLWSIEPNFWSKHFEPFFLPMYKRTLKQLELQEDTLLLDAGCGSGMFSSMAIHSGAQVIGIDAAPGLLEVARQRNPENNFMEEDLEALPFANNSFDVVAGFNSFQYAGNFENALKEATRVLKPGGRLVIGIWARPELSDATLVLKSIGSLLPPPPPGTPGPFALSEDGRIENICENIGLRMLYKTKVPCPFLYYSVNDGIKSFMGTGPAAAALNHTNKAAVEATISKSLQPFHVADGMYHLENHFLLFIAGK
ncbi:MAG: class I SAM-dependent methyltransferase [Ferruginibacter sp.]